MVSSTFAQGEIPRAIVPQEVGPEQPLLIFDDSLNDWRPIRATDLDQSKGPLVVYDLNTRTFRGVTNVQPPETFPAAFKRKTNLLIPLLAIGAGFLFFKK